MEHKKKYYSVYYFNKNYTKMELFFNMISRYVTISRVRCSEVVQFFIVGKIKNPANIYLIDQVRPKIIGISVEN